MWERHHKILAVGWRSGEICVSNLEDTKDVVYEQSSVHRDAILFLCWNGSGSRLISGDQVWAWLLLMQCVCKYCGCGCQNGMLVIWRVDSKGALYPLPVHKHQLVAPLNYCILKHCATYVNNVCCNNNISPTPLFCSLPYSWSEPETLQKMSSWKQSSEQDSIACFVASQKGEVRLALNVCELQADKY